MAISADERRSDGAPLLPWPASDRPESQDVAAAMAACGADMVWPIKKLDG